MGYWVEVEGRTGQALMEEWMDGWLGRANNSLVFRLILLF